MAGLVAVDTDLVIDFRRGRAEGVGLVRMLLVERRLRLTAVTGFELRDRGEPIGFADCLQAGMCLRNRLPLATRNRRHLERINQLQLVDLPPR